MSTLLFGHNLIYPSSSLIDNSTDTCDLNRYEQFYLHFQVSIATTSFILSTFIRTMILSPLMFIERRYQSGIILASIITRMNDMLDYIELLYVHEVWEDVANQTGVLTSSSSSKSNQVPEIDLNMSVPCQNVQTYLLQEYTNNIDYDREDSCRLRDVITQQLMIKYVKKVYDEEFDLSSHPIILRNVWSSESLNSSERRLTPKGILNDKELANVLLPNYFSDATKAKLLFRCNQSWIQRTCT